jgi:hypothetical protein
MDEAKGNQFALLLLIDLTNRTSYNFESMTGMNKKENVPKGLSEPDHFDFIV